MSVDSIVTTKSFYGAVGKRKSQHIGKVIDENVKRLKSEKIPTTFKGRIDGPSIGWKTFFRQHDAFNYARSKASDLHVFSFESENLCSETGQRMYLVASYPEFWHYYRQLEHRKKNHYEIIPEGAVCKLYFDLEYPIENNKTCDGRHMTDIFIQYVILWLEEIYKVKCTRESVLDLDASTSKKFSRHLIFQLKKIAFKDNIHEGNFVKFILQKLKERISKLKQNLSDVLDFDDHTFTTVEKDTSDDHSEDQDELCMDRICERFTDEDLLTMVVKDKNNEETLFCDEGVYTKNRNFRLYLSSKYGKCNPLILSKDNTYRPRGDEGISLDHQIFNDSLVTNIQYSPVLRILQFESECKFRNKISFSSVPTRNNRNSEDLIDGYSKSPYPEIDDFISSVLKSQSKSGRIRHWTYFSQGEVIVYDIIGYRYCHNIGREHKSNNIMILADLKKGVYYQKCYDPECKSVNFKSEDVEIPKEALPSYYFNDSFDEFDEDADDLDILNAVEEAERNMENYSL